MATADKLFECLWPFCGVGTERVKSRVNRHHLLKCFSFLSSSLSCNSMPFSGCCKINIRTGKHEVLLKIRRKARFYKIQNIATKIPTPFFRQTPFCVKKICKLSKAPFLGNPPLYIVFLYLLPKNQIFQWNPIILFFFPWFKFLVMTEKHFYL